MVPIRHTGIVVLGNFNPAIFQPEWFLNHDLLPKDEIDAALVPRGAAPLIVTHDLAQVAFRSTVLQVTHESWGLSTERPDWSADIGGVASSVFSKLPETPVRVVGLNVVEHRPPVGGSAAEVLESWAPLRALGEAVGSKPQLSAGVRSDWEEFRVRVQVEASERRAGWLYVLQNYEAVVPSTSELAKVLARWQDVLQRANVVGQRLGTCRSS